MWHQFYFLSRPLPRSEELKKLAEKLGVSDFGLQVMQGAARRTDEAELQRRVLHAIGAKREAALWLLATFSALASLASALAAWYAVVFRG